MPPPRKPYRPRPRPAIDQHAAVVDGWLIADQHAPRKQRHTARRIWQRLVTEHGATCSEVTVSRYVAKRRIELGLNRIEVAVPQNHLPGAEAEVDFGEFWTHIGGVLVKCWMFVMRLSCSGRAFHVAVTTQGQEAVLQGHVLAFNHFGGDLRDTGSEPPAISRCDTAVLLSVVSEPLTPFGTTPSASRLHLQSDRASRTEDSCTSLSHVRR